MTVEQCPVESRGQEGRKKKRIYLCLNMPPISAGNENTAPPDTLSESFPIKINLYIMGGNI